MTATPPLIGLSDVLVFGRREMAGTKAPEGQEKAREAEQRNHYASEAEPVAYKRRSRAMQLLSTRSSTGRLRMLAHFLVDDGEFILELA